MSAHGRTTRPGPIERIRIERRRLGAVGLALLVSVAVGACGISSDDKPRALDANDLPASLSANPSGTTVPGADDPNHKPVKVYLIQTTGDVEKLVSQSVAIPADYDQLARVVLEALIAQQPSSSATGDTTVFNAIPSTVQVLDATQDGKTLDLNLSDLGSVERTRQRQAAAQIVFTATGLPGIDAGALQDRRPGHNHSARRPAPRPPARPSPAATTPT